MLDTPVAYDQATRLRELALLSRRNDAVHFPRVITIVSGKGGVGKSTIALNLAITLCDLDKRVFLLDADANLSNLDIMLGVVPKIRLGHVLRGEHDLEDALVTPYPGLTLLPGSSGESNFPRMTQERMQTLIDEIQSLDQTFDYLFIDTSAGLTPEVIALAIDSDEVIVVTTPEPTAIMDAYAVIKLITLSKKGAAIGVLVNNARLPADADEAAKKLAIAVNHFLKVDFEYLGFVPFDNNVPKAVAQQKPVVQYYPKSGLSYSLHTLAQNLESASREKHSKNK